MTPEEIAYQTVIHRNKRNEQAMAIRKQIEDNAGDILRELPVFLRALTQWVQFGGDKQGAEDIESLGRRFEWRFHDKLSRVPEVWIRAPDHGSADRKTNSPASSPTFNDDGGVRG